MCFLLANILQRFDGRRTRASPVLVTNKSQVEQSYFIRFDLNPTEITRLALQLFMVSLELAIYYNLAACLDPSPLPNHAQTYFDTIARSAILRLKVSFNFKFKRF